MPNIQYKSGKIYCLVNPTNDEVFYVGCTRLPLYKRLNFHVHASTVSSRVPVCVYIHNLRSLGLRPKIKLLEIVKFPNAQNVHALDVERKWINDLIRAGSPLTNVHKVFVVC